MAHETPFLHTVPDIAREILTELYKPFRRTRTLWTILAVIALSGCASTTPVPEPRPKESIVDTSTSVTDLLRRAGQTTPDQATRLRLQAAKYALNSEQPEQAKRILDSIEDVVGNPLQELILLSAETAIALGSYQEALGYLNDQRLQAFPLTRDLQIRTGRLRSNAYYLARSYIASARERIYIDPLLTEPQQTENRETLFATLLNVPARSLTAQAVKAITSDLRGWLSLAAMTRQYQNDPLRQLQELNNWRMVWPNHPATSKLPRSLTMLSRVVSEQPDVIALILPFQGPLASMGRAIRDGFLAAHYELNGSANIIAYDSSQASSVELTRRATAEGADLIIGPLAREQVDRLAAVSLGVPVLALNRTTGNRTNANLYQFGLAPEDEVRQVVLQAHREGLRKAIVLYPEGDWGERNFNVFSQSWQDLEGILVESSAYASQRDYSGLISNLLNVDGSQQRSSELRRIIGTPFEFTPRRRQDVDFVFLLANPAAARGINPALERYHAEDVPVYATSHIHEYGESWIEAIDLGTIRFCDIPWKLTDSDPLQNKINTAWPGSRGTLVPFYALGVDAHRLYPRLQQFKELPDERLFGATGVLSLNKDNIIERELMWAQFRDGRPITAPMVVR